MIRSVLKQLKKISIYLIDFLRPNENIISSKRKWNNLANENAKYYIWSEKLNSSENEFRESGMRDYDSYINQDKVLFKKLKDINAKNVLEIGCGIGRITEFFVRDFDKVYGLDISGEMIAKAKSRLPGKKYNFLESDGLHIPLSKDSIDFIFSFIVFQHMPSKNVIEINFQEAYRVLRHKGIFKVQLRGCPVKKSEWFYGPSFDIASASRLARRTGFVILNAHVENEKYLWLTLSKG